MVNHIKKGLKFHPLSYLHPFLFRLRAPQDGLFMGRVDAVDPSNHSYR